MSRYLRFIPLVGISLLLVFTFRLYTFSYFWLDDFANLYWVQNETLGDALWLVVTPSTETFRPLGMFFYWAGLQLFDRNPLPYHVVMWALHSLNVFLVYLVLKRFTDSRAGASVGALLYVFPAVFNDVFWSFGIIFELLGAALFFTGLLVWQRKARTVPVVLLAAGIFFFGMKTKEMVITLPAIWLAQDLLLRRPLKFKDVSYLVAPGVIGLWFGIQKVLEMRAPDPLAPYFMDLRGHVMGMGYGYYFNGLLGTSIRWEKWAVGFVALLILSLAMKWRHAAFFLIYVFVAFLPIIFLVNHRDPFYWYFPMFGVCGLAAVIVRALTTWLSSRVPEQKLAPYAAAVFGILCVGLYLSSRDDTEKRRLWQQGIAHEYRGFVEGLKALPAPKPGEVLFFKGMPEFFNEKTLLYASQIAMRRPDIDVRVVEEFPEGAPYRLEFENSRVIVSPK